MSRFKNITEIEKDRFLRSPSQGAEPIPPPQGSETDFLHPPMVEGEILESFIGMRDSLRNLAKDRPLRVIGVTSSREAEGKTRIATGLALAFAMDPRRRVLLVDGNLRAPAVAALFRLSPSPGLTDLILDDLPLEQAVQQLADFPLFVLASGRSNLTPAEILSFPRFARRMAEIREAFDVTIVDTSAVKKCMDFELFSKHLDGTVLVLESDKTQLTLVQETKARIEAAGVPILGVTLNRVHNQIPASLNQRFGLD